MQDLKIYGASGAVVKTQALTDAKGPILVLRAGEGVELAETAGEGVQVIAALLRDGDDWTLASADPARPVACGGKFAGSLPLVPGSACLAGGFVFRIETDAVATGNVLIWRVGKAPVAAEPVLSGRNFVAADALRDGALTVNPAMPGELHFEFYPTLEGLDVVMPNGERASFPRSFCFAVGAFRGLLLTAAEATAALKADDPFAYPSRRVRRRLLAALLGAGLVLLGAALLGRLAARLETQLAAAPLGAVREERPTVAEMPVYFGDDYVYLLSFYRSLPLVLGAQPSPVAEDLIRRAASYRENAEVQRTSRFLRDVTAIQRAILDQRWEELAACLDQVDAEMFDKADAGRFLEDAREILRLVDVQLPESALRYCQASAAERERISARIAALTEDMGDNLFLESEAMAALVRRLQENRQVFREFVTTRDRVLAQPRVVAAEVRRLVQALVAAEPLLDEDFPELARAAREPIVAYVERELTELFGRFHTAKDYDTEMVAIGPLCELAAVAKVPEAQLEEWRRRAQEMTRRVEAHFRDLYQRYRLLAADDPEAARQLLEELLAADDPTNRFHAWAVRERARLEGKDAK